jgi:hypothetical protein
MLLIYSWSEDHSRKQYYLAPGAGITRNVNEAVPYDDAEALNIIRRINMGAGRDGAVVFVQNVPPSHPKFTPRAERLNEVNGVLIYCWHGDVKHYLLSHDDSARTPDVNSACVFTPEQFDELARTRATIHICNIPPTHPAYQGPRKLPKDIWKCPACGRADCRETDHNFCPEGSLMTEPVPHTVDQKIAADLPLSTEEVAKLTDSQLEHWRLKVTTDAKTRKGMPLATGLLDYFPDACLDVSRLSRIGNDQHNPGEPMHWARGKSGDQRDTVARHTLQSGEIDSDKVLHDTKVAWRALAQAQLSIERLRACGIVYPPVEV